MQLARVAAAATAARLAWAPAIAFEAPGRRGGRRGRTFMTILKRRVPDRDWSVRVYSACSTLHRTTTVRRRQVPTTPQRGSRAWPAADRGRRAGSAVRRRRV